jgi:hypothetical protein
VNNDEDIAGRLLDRLRLDRSVANIECVVAHFWCLRNDVTFSVDVNGDERRKLKQLVGHARALALCMKEFSPIQHHLLATSLYPDRAHKDAELKFDEWLCGLARIAEQVDAMMRSSSPDPRESCARITGALMSALNVKPAKSTKYYDVASLVWEAVAHEGAPDMKRACNRALDERQQHEAAGK